MKTVNQYMRSLHRDLGFFAIGLVIIYALSGIVLIYRNTDFMKSEKKKELVLPAQLDKDGVGSALKIKRMEVLSEDDQTIAFADGTYDKITGKTSYVSKEIVSPFNRFISLHKMTGDNPLHWMGIVVGAILLFLAVSSFWMYKPSTKLFRRGIVLAVSGVVVSLLLLLFN